jgi:hypothetical protein
VAKKRKIRWLSTPEEKDYPAAESYLSLLYDAEQVAKLVAALRNAPPTEFKSKDIFRASDLSLLGISNRRVEKDRQKVKDGIPLSPILLVRDSANGKVVIADGYHRMCALYSIDENEFIHCRIVSLKS